MHYDTLASFETRRILTAILYLNEVEDGEWKTEWGGQLRIYPWPFYKPLGDSSFDRQISSQNTIA